MRDVFIPFRPELKKAILEGRKTMTARNKKYGNPGDRFTVGSHGFILESVRRITLFRVANDYYKEEGLESPEEFIRTWTEIHPQKGYISDQVVYLHVFRREFKIKPLEEGRDHE